MKHKLFYQISIIALMTSLLPPNLVIASTQTSQQNQGNEISASASQEETVSRLKAIGLQIADITPDVLNQASMFGDFVPLFQEIIKSPGNKDFTGVTFITILRPNFTPEQIREIISTGVQVQNAAIELAFGNTADSIMTEVREVILKKNQSNSNPTSNNDSIIDKAF